MSVSTEQDDHGKCHDIALTDGQRRAVGSLLSQVAHAVARYETLVVGTPPAEHLSYTQTRDDLRATERAQLNTAMTALVREANALAALCQIPTQWTDVRAALAGQFSILWSDAEDTRPSRLTGYGPLRPETAAALAPRVAALARLSFLVATIAQGQAAPADVQRILDALGRSTGTTPDAPLAE